MELDTPKLELCLEDRESQLEGGSCDKGRICT